MKDLHGKTAVVTGAGGGIGGAVACALAREGVSLAVCDKDNAALMCLKEKLDAISPDAIAQSVDITDREALAAFADSVPTPDMLVNCSGVFISGGFLDLTFSDWDWVLGVNLIGAINVCHCFIPRMAARRQAGHVVNLASMYGYWISPGVSGYLTSKFGVLGFSESLREDLRATGIQVSTVCPGMIHTPLVRNMRICNAPGQEECMRAAIEKRYARRNYPPERVATAIVQAIRKGKGLVLVSPESWLMYYLERFYPQLSRLIARRAAARIFST